MSEKPDPPEKECGVCKDTIVLTEERYIKFFEGRQFSTSGGEHYGSTSWHFTEDESYAHLKCVLENNSTTSAEVEK